MFIKFRLKNYRSFKYETEFSMVADSIKEHPGNTCDAKKGIKTLKSSVIYGANGSGKSNLLNALMVFKRFVIHSVEVSLGESNNGLDRFQLDDISMKSPCGFEVTFLYEDIIYRYGFSADDLKIHEEWLFYTPKKSEVELFKRDGQTIKVNPKWFSEGIGNTEKTRENVLFLSLMATLNGEVSKSVVNWFSKLNIISGLNDDNYSQFTKGKMKNEASYRKKALAFMQSIGLGIKDILVQEKSIDLPPSIPERIRNSIIEQERTHIELIKSKYSESGDIIGDVAMSIKSESEGTQKLFYLLGPVYDTLQEGKVLIIDEFDARLHPLMTITLIGLFNSSKTNLKGAQLVFATHDTNLLSNKLFRRDQVWFVEQDQYSSSHIYSLSDFKTRDGKKIRNDNKYEKNYIQGLFGAIPYINEEELSSFFSNE